MASRRSCAAPLTLRRTAVVPGTLSQSAGSLGRKRTESPSGWVPSTWNVPAKHNIGMRNHVATPPSEVRVAAASWRPGADSVRDMRKLAAWCHDRRRTVIGLWVGAFLILAALWGTAAGTYVNKFNLPGTESQRTYDLLKSRFPQQAGDTGSVVFAVKDGKVLDHRKEIARVRAEIAKSPEVLAVGKPVAASRDGRIT